MLCKRSLIEIIRLINASSQLINLLSLRLVNLQYL